MALVPHLTLQSAHSEEHFLFGPATNSPMLTTFRWLRWECTFEVKVNVEEQVERSEAMAYQWGEKNFFCSSGGTRSSSHIHMAAHHCLPFSFEDQMCSSGLHRHQAHTWCTYIHASKANRHIKDFFPLKEREEKKISSFSLIFLSLSFNEETD